MICGAAQGMELAGRVLHCLGGPASVWAWALAAGVALVSALLAWRARRPPAARLAGVLGFTLVAALLALAIERPVLRQVLGQGEGGRILVLLDASESFWREPAAAVSALALAAERIGGFLETVPLAERPLWRGELRSFGAAAGVSGADNTAENLVEALRRHRVAVPEPATDLRAGLVSALAGLRGRGGPRMVVLVSDLLAGAPPGDGLLAEFRAEGIPVHLVAAGASAPAAGLIAADIGPEHVPGEDVVLRGTVLGAGELTLTRGAQTARLSVPPGDRLRALRLSTGFDQRGLQGVGLGFVTPAGVQGRSLFTLVRGPARLLAFGPAPWPRRCPRRAGGSSAPIPPRRPRRWIMTWW